MTDQPAWHGEPDLPAMRRALVLAAQGPLGDPNPRVGAVVVAADGTVAGEGFHAGAGSAHAEVVALARAGDAARGGTAVVTLEPCNHTGLTGPCTRALVDAVLNGTLDGLPFATDPIFGLAYPTTCPGVPSGLLDPRGSWPDTAAYDAQARELAQRFHTNFARFPRADEATRAAGPRGL